MWCTCISLPSTFTRILSPQNFWDSTAARALSSQSCLPLTQFSDDCCLQHKSYLLLCHILSVSFTEITENVYHFVKVACVLLTLLQNIFWLCATDTFQYVLRSRNISSTMQEKETEVKLINKWMFVSKMLNCIFFFSYQLAAIDMNFQSDLMAIFEENLFWEEENCNLTAKTNKLPPPENYKLGWLYTFSLKWGSLTRNHRGTWIYVDLTDARRLYKYWRVTVRVVTVDWSHSAHTGTNLSFWM